MSKLTQDRLDKLRNSTANKFGPKYVNFGTNHYHLDVVPSPSLMLDYKTGIGGFPYGHAVEIYGANKIGKSSALAYGTLANVVKQDKVGVLLAVEPRMVTPEDREWSLALGLDPDEIVVEYPDNVQEAFNMLRELVFGPERPDYIVVDSIGGLGNESSGKEDGKTKAYGISGEVTSGLNDLMPRLYKNNQGLMLLNQQRQAPSPAGRPGMKIFESPGGEALKHHMRIRIHVKPGKEKFTAKIDDDSILVGQELVCAFRKNNMSQSQEKTAKFNFFHVKTDDNEIGVDSAQDIINVGKLTGVLQGGGWLEHHTFPGKLNGKKAVREYLNENPQALDVIRHEVMSVMLEREINDGAVKKKKAATAQVEKVKSGE
jgi:RecA/RadA recombinase